MEKKYEILKDTKIRFLGSEIYKIRALKDFGNVKKGDIGGFVESEENLSQDDDCWIYDNAAVYDSAFISGNAKVCGNAKISSNAIVKNYAVVCDNAKVSGNAIVKNYAVVFGNAKVFDNAFICDHAVVYGSTFIYGNAEVSGNVEVSDNAIVRDFAKVYGNATVFGNATINNCAKIKNQNQWFVIDNVGSRKDNITFYKTDKVIYVNVGCFNGTLDEFIEQVRTTHKGNKFEKEYLQIVELAKIKL